MQIVEKDEQRVGWKSGIKNHQITELHRLGLTDGEIANRLGVRRRLVSQRRRKLGLFPALRRVECAGCGRIFTARSWNAKFCSDGCEAPFRRLFSRPRDRTIPPDELLNYLSEPRSFADIQRKFEVGESSIYASLLRLALKGKIADLGTGLGSGYKTAFVRKASDEKIVSKKRLDEKDAIWAAGVLERASIQARPFKGTGPLTISIQLSSKVSEVLEHLREIFGGSLVYYKPKRVVFENGRLPRPASKRIVDLHSYRWEVHGWRALRVAESTYPFLKTSRRDRWRDALKSVGSQLFV